MTVLLITLNIILIIGFFVIGRHLYDVEDYFKTEQELIKGHIEIKHGFYLKSLKMHAKDLDKLNHKVSELTEKTDTMVEQLNKLEYHD